MKTSAIFIILSVIFIPQILKSQVNKQDSLILEDLYNSTDGPNWNGGNWHNGGWVSGWNGITVENGRVTEIDLHYDLFMRWPKINGSLPESIGNLSALTKLVIGGLSGSIPASICNLKSLTHLSLYGEFTGGIPENIGNLNKLISLSLSRNLSGNIPESIGNLTALTHLRINGNSLSGVIPESIGNLSNLQLLELDHNDLHGEIPESIGNLTLLTTLSISIGNYFSGQLPNSFENLDLLKELRLYGDFTGEIPSTIGDMDSLEFIEIRDYEGGLTGGIPESFGNLSNLSRLYIQGLSGEIHESIGNLKKLNVFDIHSSNLTGEIPNSIGNLTALTEFIVSRNNLSGEIPESIGNMTALTDFDVSRNNLSGEIPSTIEKLTNLTDLRFSYNHFSTITKIPPNLTTFYIENNNLDFNDLEPFAEKEIEYFYYFRQDTLTLELTIDNKETNLTMHAGGNATTYQWFYDSEEIVDATNNTYIIPTGKEIRKYHCEAKNVLLPNLTLIGVYKKKEEKDCWGTGRLTFCLSSGEWEKGSGTNKIKTTDIISINDFLFFDGTMSIDTIVLEIEANGRFYIKSNKLPTDSEGTYTLSEGEHNLKLLGDDGKLTNFLNSTLTKTAMLFGTPLKINDLQLVKRQDTLGIKIGCSVNIPKLSIDCGSSATLGTDIELKNLEITNVGITQFGFSIDNLGFIKKDYCLNNVTLEYDWKKDVLVAGADISLPFFADVAGGLKFEKGSLDSVAWGIEGGVDKLLLKTFPIGLGTFGVKGFYGHVAGIKTLTDFKKPNLIDLKIGGVFSDVLSDDIYRITGDGRTIWPTTFEVTGTGQLLKPTDNLPFQFAGETGMSYDAANKQIKVYFNGNFGTVDEQTWLIEGDGEFAIDHRSEPTQFSCNFGGEFSLPKLSDGWPFNWINTFFSFPITLGTRNAIFNENLNVVHGVLYFYPLSSRLFKVHYILNTEKKWYEEGYMKFPQISRIGIGIGVKSGLLAGDISKTFTIPMDTEFGIVEINSVEKVPISSITSSTGEKYSESSPDNNIFYSESSDKKEAFWSILNPQSGDWIITLENPGQTDSIFTIFQFKDQDFKFSMNQTGNNITVNWDVAQVEEGQIINLMLDDNSADFDGFRIANGNATLGSLSFTLDENTPNCNYYLYAQLIDSFNVIQSYADEAIKNPLATLAPPENLSSEYNSETGEFDFTWTENPTSEISGYILSVTDELGNDSVYAILNSSQTNISLFIEDFETKSAKIEAYNQDWKIGCPTTSLKLTTSIEDNFEINEPDNKLNIFPNPTTGNCTIRYFVSEDSNCEIQVFDIQGREIARPLHEFKSVGFHQLNYEYGQLPNGMYIIKFINEYQNFTIKSILSK